MRKKIRLYHQHPIEDDRLETCGPACMLMLLDLYEKLENPKYPTVRKEMYYYSMFRSHVRYNGKRFPGVNGAAMANCLSGEGLTVHLAHSSENMMDNRAGYFPESLFADLYTEYHDEIKKCCNSDRVQISTGVEITCDTLRQELDAGRQIILECIIPGDADGMHDHMLHWIVVYEYSEESFYACDPLPDSGKIKLTADELENFMNTPIGRIYLAVSEEKTESMH